MNEIELQRIVQLEASRLGMRLWRNNVGATRACEHINNCAHATGRPIRYGLANESAAVNRQMKSSDLIGIIPRIITPEMIGQTVAVFTSIEVKRPGWVYRGEPREKAQAAWIALVQSLGGIGKFVNGEGQLP